MKFRTEVDITPFTEKIKHEDSILTIGSCFAENIGFYFSKLKFKSLINPFGVLYNAASIFNTVNQSLSGKSIDKDDLVCRHDEWHSFYHHSNFSHHRPEVVLQNIDKASFEFNSFIKNCDWAIISLGTSFYYEFKESEVIVSNCHKIPQNEFTRKFLDVEQNTRFLVDLVKLIRKANPESKFIFTVSPVRHWKDGANENQLSKSSLHLAIKNVLNETKGIYYFPSYEIVIDELRDYRFYAKDMIHPSEEAVEYIWDKFCECCLPPQSLLLLADIKNIIDSYRHRIRNIESPQSQKFIQKTIDKMGELEKKHPYLDFKNEKEKFKSYLID